MDTQRHLGMRPCRSATTILRALWALALLRSLPLPWLSRGNSSPTTPGLARWTASQVDLGFDPLKLAKDSESMKSALAFALVLYAVELQLWCLYCLVGFWVGLWKTLRRVEAALSDVRSTQILKSPRNACYSWGMQLKEIKNGRLAMMAFMSCVGGHYLPGSVPGVSALPRESAAAQAPAFCGATPASSIWVWSFQDCCTIHHSDHPPILGLDQDWSEGLWAAATASWRLWPWLVTMFSLARLKLARSFALATCALTLAHLWARVLTWLVMWLCALCTALPFKVTNGELIDWCVSPPIIGPLTGLIVEKKNLLVFEVRQGGFLGSGDVEVLVDVNAKKAYEANYWKGLLDAQGKDDGTYY